MKTVTATPATTEHFHLGEGPVWDPLRQRLLWVDVEAGTVHEGHLDADGRITCRVVHTAGGSVGAVAVSAAGELLVAEGRTLATIDARGVRTELARILPDGRPRRLNDGACDPAGRFVVGSLGKDGRRGEEVLVRLDGRDVTVLDSDLTLSNGLAWNPAGDLFYSIDSGPGVVHVRDYDPRTGATGARRVLLADTGATPDGMCVDADGNLWIALWGAGQVRCHAPDATLLGVVEVDAPHTTSVAFAGPDRDVLVITTATEDLTPEDLVAHPASGRLFTARVGATGLPTPYWVS